MRTTNTVVTPNRNGDIPKILAAIYQTAPLSNRLHIPAVPRLSTGRFVGFDGSRLEILRREGRLVLSRLV